MIQYRDVENFANFMDLLGQIFAGFAGLRVPARM